MHELNILPCNIILCRGVTIFGHSKHDRPSSMLSHGHNSRTLSGRRCPGSGEVRSREHINRFKTIPVLYREYSYFVSRFYGSVLQGDRRAAYRKEHTNFAAESAFPTADNVQKEIVVAHRSPQALKMLSFYMYTRCPRRNVP